MKPETQQTYVWSADGVMEAVQCADPELEIDGDLFWIAVTSDGVRLAFGAWDGQAARCLRQLLEVRPELAEIYVADTSPAFEAGQTIRSIVEAMPAELRDIDSVAVWYHGTSSARIDTICDEGLRGDIDMDARAWKVSEPSWDTVYLTDCREVAFEYARRAALIHGGEPVVVEIDARQMETQKFCIDRDFHATDYGRAWREGTYGDHSEVGACLSLTRKVGYRQVIPSSAITGVCKRTADGWVEVEATRPALACR